MSVTYRTALPRIAAKKPPISAFRMGLTFRSGPARRPC